MRTTTDEAADIRAQYKRIGWSSRQIGVRAEYFSLGSEIRITIKDPIVDAVKAKAIAEGKERIHRCEITGEILGGGNRYVSVSYGDECKKILARRWWDVFSFAVAKQVERGPSRELQPIVGIPGALVQYEDKHTGRVWLNDRPVFQFYPVTEQGIEEGSFYLAVAVEKMEAENAAQS